METYYKATFCNIKATLLDLEQLCATYGDFVSHSRPNNDG